MEKMYLSEGEVNKALINYFSQFIDGKLEISKYIFMGADRLHIGFSLLVRDENKNLIEKIRITEDKLREALIFYLNDTNKDLEEFKYLGGVRREGYYQGEETPYFDGIEMQTKEKEKGQKLTLTEKKDNNKIISTWY